MGLRGKFSSRIEGINALVSAMKTLATVLCSVVFALSFSSCGMLKEKYDKNEKATAAYLSEKKTAPAKINIEGLYYSPEWGIVVLKQSAKGELTGIFQDYYHVRGVVSGKKAYIALVDSDWVEYTVQLQRKSANVLTGYYSAHTPFSESDQREVILNRISL